MKVTIKALDETVNCKKMVAQRSRCEGVYNRAGEASVAFCKKGGAAE